MAARKTPSRGSKPDKIMRDALQERRHELFQRFGIDSVRQTETLQGAGDGCLVYRSLREGD